MTNLVIKDFKKSAALGWQTQVQSSPLFLCPQQHLTMVILSCLFSAFLPKKRTIAAVFPTNSNKPAVKGI